MKPVVFIHAKKSHFIIAKVAEYSLKTASKTPDAFETKIIFLEDFPQLTGKEGRHYKRPPGIIRWRNSDPQAFCPLRFLPPQLMGYEGRALVMDADILAVGDICELLFRDMGDKSILCRYTNYPDSKKKKRRGHHVSSLMLLDCAKLKHWQWEKQINDLFAMKLHYTHWMHLANEPEGSIGIIGNEWNSLDELNDGTKMLHNTNRNTQPWMTGIPYNRIIYGREGKYLGLIPKHWVRGSVSWMLGKGYLPFGRYQEHPDKKQEMLFLSRLKGCIDEGFITHADLSAAVRKKHVRPDIFQKLDEIQFACRK